MSHERYMRHALALAKRGAGWVNPNPQVGCVLVKDGRIIAEGWHHNFGNLHAERDALSRCTESPAGATAYVTLEPCCHTGKQPPCTNALIEAGISQVVVGAADSNPLVAGKGVSQLRDAGITVLEGVLSAECEELNRAWLHYITTGRPFVTMKYAMTLDGKIACHTGSSKWVTGSAARARVHEDRAKAAGILVGVGTVLADDPLLTARVPGAETHSPTRIVADSHLRTPLESQLVKTAAQVPVTIACCEGASAARKSALEAAGCTVVELPAENGRVSIDALLSHLGGHGIDSLIAEGGAELHGSLLDGGFVNRVQAYVAPKLVGGAGSPTPVAGTGRLLMDEALALESVRTVQLGNDFLVEGEVTPCSPA